MSEGFSRHLPPRALLRKDPRYPSSAASLMVRRVLLSSSSGIVWITSL